MKKGKDDIYIKTGKGNGGFWADKEEYEAVYRGTKGVDTYNTGDDEELGIKDTQIFYNKIDGDSRNLASQVSDYLKYESGDKTTISNKIKATLKDVDEYLEKNPNDSRFKSLRSKLDSLRKLLTNKKKG